jgi:protein-disulfide isomerase
VIEKYPNDVKVVFKHYPIRSHQYSEKAARASVAAHRQGKFWEFHDKLFDNYKNLSDVKIYEFIRDLKLDRDKFEKDWKDPAVDAKVESDQREGTKIGVRGTPTIFVNGRRLRKRNIEGFSQFIDDELNKLSAAKEKPAG